MMSTSISPAEQETKADPLLQRFVDAAIFDQRIKITPGKIEYRPGHPDVEMGHYVRLPNTVETVTVPFPATKKDQASFAYRGAGITLFSPPKNRHTDQANVVASSVQRDKNKWVIKQTAVMEQLRGLRK